MTDSTARIHTDGAARGNPGPAAWAYVIESPGELPVEHAEKLGNATNNVAEYTALVHALNRASEMGLRQIQVFSDSELMIKQIRGEYAVKNADLRLLYDQAHALLSGFQSARLQHIPRAQNKRADALCNQALDGPTKSSSQSKATSAKKKPSVRRRPEIDDIAIECLRTAARSWGATNGNDPAPALVWDQIWSVLAENGVLKSSR